MSRRRRFWNVFRAARVQDDIQRELAFHLAERADQLRADGLSAEEATRLARRQLGNLSVQAERTRDADVALWADACARNVRFAVRALARNPGFAIPVALTLALGIGANTAVFSAIDTILLQPLPFPDGDRLMRVTQTSDDSAETNIAPARLEDWNRLSDTFEAITGYFMEDVSDTSGELPERVRRAFVAPRFLDVWGMAPARGRDFVAAEHQDGGPSAVLISDRYWRSRLGGNPNALGSPVRIGATSYPIVGIMPAAFRFPDRDVDLWLPSTAAASAPRAATWYEGVGRLEPGVTVDQARADLAVVQTQLGAQYPDTDAAVAVSVVPLKDAAVGGVRGSLWLLFGAVSVLLLIMCTNIAALLLSRAVQRQQEVAVRFALGASRVTLAAQMLTETAVLVFVGASISLLVVAGASAAFRMLAPTFPRLDEVSISWSMVLCTVVSAIVVAVFCGLFPAIRCARGLDALGAAGRAHVSHRHSLQWLLVGVQVALSVMLLAGAGLLLRSVQELSRVAPGFDVSRVLTFRVSGSYAESRDYNRVVQRIDGTLDELQALPGVDSAATATMLPGVPGQYEIEFTLVEGRADTEPRLVAESRFVSPSYFETMQIPVLDGEPCRRRPVGESDVMVNRAFAERYFTPRSPIGLHLVDSGRIVGIVGDARERGIDRDPVPTVYACFSAPNPMPAYLVRTRGEPEGMAQAVRVKLKELEPLRSVYDIAPLDEQIGSAFSENRLRSWLLALFAGTALSLACVSLYGTLSYTTRLRRREIGLRLALGAGRGGVVRQLLASALRVVGLACVIGLGLTALFTRVLSGMLFGVSTTDPATLAGVVALVLTVAVFAALLPAVRAALLEPVRVLREE